LSGYLKMRNDKGARYGWGKKVFAIVKNYRFSGFERPNDQDNPDKALFSYNLKSHIFIIRSVDETIIRETEKELSLIFAVFYTEKDAILPSLKILQKSESFDSGSYSPASFSLTLQKEAVSLSVPVLEEKIQHLKDELQKEEKIKIGAENFLKVSAGAAQQKAQEQLEGLNNKISSIKSQIANYQSILESKQSVQQDSGENERKKMIKKEIASLRSVRKAFEKQISTSREKNKQPKAEQIEQYEQAKEKIAALKLELKGAEDEEPNDLGALESSVDLLDDYDAEYLGHEFVIKKDQEHKECFHCHEFLDSYKIDGFYCRTCGLMCHRNCHSLLRVSCEEMQKTKHIKPVFFLAQDSDDQKRWLTGLQEMRRLALKQLASENDKKA